MCVVSGIFDYGFDKWSPRPAAPSVPFPTPAEIAEFRRLLEAARRFDEVAGEPDCEIEAKKERLRNLLTELAELSGFEIDITFLD